MTAVDTYLFTFLKRSFRFLTFGSHCAKLNFAFNAYILYIINRITSLNIKISKKKIFYHSIILKNGKHAKKLKT